MVQPINGNRKGLELVDACYESPQPGSPLGNCFASIFACGVACLHAKAVGNENAVHATDILNHATIFLFDIHGSERGWKWSE